MTLEVIGAGFGRTGTESMKRALEMLGFGPCHHMHKVLPNPAQVAFWTDLAHGGTPDWETGLGGYRAAVDWPSAFFWRELAAAYPQAKLVLTLRSAESWWASFEQTILKYLIGVREAGETDQLGYKLIAERTFDGRPEDRAHAIAVYERNIRKVTATIPAERLLVHCLGDGWEPLCCFLGRPVPDAPYPRGNDVAAFHEKLRALSGDEG